MKITIAAILITLSMSFSSIALSAEEWAIGYPVGTSIAKIEAVDQFGQLREFNNLKGKNGLLLLFNRSTVW